jgi:cytochrome b561
MTGQAMGSERSRYSSVAIGFHWIIGLLVILNIALVFIAEDMEGASRGQIMTAHKAIGISVLFLSLGRLFWRLGHRPPPLPGAIPAWQRALARANHILFYVLMIGIPLSGWMWMSAGLKRDERPISFFGLFDVPFLPVPRGEASGAFLSGAHETMGLAMIALILLHVAGVVKHHLVDRDPILRRMTPG